MLMLKMYTVLGLRKQNGRVVKIPDFGFEVQSLAANSCAAVIGGLS